MSFSSTENNNVVIWLGNPDCQAGHVFILDKLKSAGVTFLTDEAEVNHSVIGNLGEFTSFNLGLLGSFKGHIPFPANAFNPLSGISKNEIDIVWIKFGNTSAEDIAVVQEVKTTGNPDLSYARNLLEDIDKLFEVNPKFTLHTRLQCIKNEIELKLGLPHLCPRVSELAGHLPVTSPKIRLIPTLFHELNGSDAERKMTAVRTGIIGKGWPASAVKAWAIGLSDLDERLVRIALGQT
jgi:hypothetical protein